MNFFTRHLLTFTFVFAGALHREQLLVVRVRRAGIRTGLLNDQPQRAGAVGGPVWGLLEHGPVHHRPVHRQRSGQVGEAVGARPPPAPRHGR